MEYTYTEDDGEETVEVEEGEEYEVSGHEHIPDGTTCEVQGAYPDRHDGYHPIKVTYYDEDNESESAGRVKVEHIL